MSMNISKLYQRAHALRMEDKRTGAEATPAEFYVGRVIGEAITDLVTASGELLLPRYTRIRQFTLPLRNLLHQPDALRRVMVQGRSDDMAALWERLLRTYSGKPRLLLAIADGMEA